MKLVIRNWKLDEEIIKRKALWLISNFEFLISAFHECQRKALLQF